MDHNLLILIPVFTIVDALYLNFSSKFFNKVINDIQGSDIKLRIIPTVACYIFLVFGVYHFIISKKKSPDEAFLLGLVVYGVYETTNYAIIDKWPLKAVIMDTLWGGILFYLSTAITYNIKTRNVSIIMRSLLNFAYTLVMGSVPSNNLNNNLMT